jgi:hypothetical protein
MKKVILTILFVFSIAALQAQKDSVNFYSVSTQKNATADRPPATVTIYPVPVRNNLVNIKCDKPISFLKITNIIGQDIFKTRYNNPQTILKIMLDYPQRGMYLVTLIFEDGERIVKKIMIEQSE